MVRSNLRRSSTNLKCTGKVHGLLDHPLFHSLKHSHIASSMVAQYPDYLNINLSWLLLITFPEWRGGQWRRSVAITPALGSAYALTYNYCHGNQTCVPDVLLEGSGNDWTAAKAGQITPYLKFFHFHTKVINQRLNRTSTLDGGAALRHRRRFSGGLFSELKSLGGCSKMRRLRALEALPAETGP